LIAIQCPTCLGDTLWRYPHTAWAMAHVPGVPRRFFRYVGKDGTSLSFMGMSVCPDAFGHVEKYRRDKETT
jgi:hypothetical protein